MPITRTPIYDDSGAGTDGTVIDNAWKQELYDQIDALAGASIVSFTFTDASGAGLVFSTNSCGAIRIGRLVVIQAQLVYPATANANNAALGGLPYPVQPPGHGGLYLGLGGVPMRFWMAAGTVVLNPIHRDTGTPLPNSALSGTNLTIQGVYFTS